MFQMGFAITGHTQNRFVKNEIFSLAFTSRTSLEDFVLIAHTRRIFG